MRTGRRAAVVGLALAGLAAGGPASADWLVTRQGTRVETRGAWEVKGKLVVFRTPGGELASLRLTEVDLDASRRVTAQAERAVQAVEEVRRRSPEKKASVRVVTDKDVRRVETAGPSGGDAAAPRLTVTGYERTPDPENGVLILTGTLRNDSGAKVTDISLSVQLLGASGQPVSTGQAELTANALDPGQQSGFRVELPGSTAYSDVKFEPRALAQKESEPAPTVDGG
ncbi:MAG TPA: FxLYD domain-containing protein [Thermoanaerobaculia bacterium]|nr:FxLYD domain-containing protein [Thermoanaerobaculia bacterium]